MEPVFLGWSDNQLTGKKAKNVRFKTPPQKKGQHFAPLGDDLLMRLFLKADPRDGFRCLEKELPVKHLRATTRQPHFRTTAAFTKVRKFPAKAQAT